MAILTFDRGTLVLEKQEGEEALPALPRPWQWDARIGALRAPAIVYRDTVLWCRSSGIPLEDQARAYATTSWTHRGDHQAHPHQMEAFAAWKRQGCLGIAVLPTGAGKSYLAELCIAFRARDTLVVVPTLDLMNQWQERLARAFGVDVGRVGGGVHEVRSLTVTTYDSAYLRMDSLGSRFGLLVFDECHHLPGPSYGQAAESSLAPFRLGLTATLERQDGGHERLDTLVGPVVYRREIGELAGLVLAEYDVVRVDVDLSRSDSERYREARSIYRDFLSVQSISIGSAGGFRRFLTLAGRTDEGRRAFLAYRESRSLALAAPSKLEALDRLLVTHRGEQVVIFTHENALAFQISRLFLIPSITHHTAVSERREILERFKKNEYPALVTSRVLNEGIDLPAANIGIIMSGSATVREHVQRLGRILRRGQNKHAILYEIVTRDTLEEGVSDRRRDHSAYRRDR